MLSIQLNSLTWQAPYKKTRRLPALLLVLLPTYTYLNASVMPPKNFKMDVISIILIVSCLLNLTVSIFLILREDMETTQRVVQILIVWLIPFLGALGLYLFHKSQDDYVSIPFKGKFGGGDNGSSLRWFN